jgi:hypothetical protein
VSTIKIVPLITSTTGVIPKTLSKGLLLLLLGRIRKKLTQNSRKIVCQTIISPHIDYCSSILYLASKKQLKRLKLLHNRAMRIVLNCHWRTSREWMLNILGWQSIKQRINFNTYYGTHIQNQKRDGSRISD